MKKIRWQSGEEDSISTEYMITPFCGGMAQIYPISDDSHPGKFHFLIEFPDGTECTSPERGFSTRAKAKEVAEEKIKNNLWKMKKAIDKYLL